MARVWAKMPILRRTDWLEASQRHIQRVSSLLEAGRDAKGGLREDHPVFNFLRSYYFVRTANDIKKKLLRWSPGALALLAPERYLPAKTISESLPGLDLEVVEDNAGLSFARVRMTKASFDNLRFSQGVLEATTTNAPILNCYGMHEWAMLYQEPNEEEPFATKFQSLPRRVSQGTINETVRSQKVNCSHFDAMRFFAPSAKPYSKFDGLTREGSFTSENPACLHAQMDLLRHALKLGPLLSGEILVECLEIALEARSFDVAASPYDASQFGLESIPVETSEGRALYKSRQIQLAQRARPLRKALLDIIQTTLEVRDTDLAVSQM